MRQARLRKKSYVITVNYKTARPMLEFVDYHYHDLAEAKKHIEWLLFQVEGQNGEDVKRKNVVVGFRLQEFVRSKKRDKELPPILRFVAPQGRERPKTGKEVKSLP